MTFVVYCMVGRGGVGWGGGAGLGWVRGGKRASRMGGGSSVCKAWLCGFANVSQSAQAYIVSFLGGYQQVNIQLHLSVASLPRPRTQPMWYGQAHWVDRKYGQMYSDHASWDLSCN